MIPPLDRFYDQFAAREAQRGQRTGGFSKILSDVSLLCLVLAIVHIVTRAEWIAACLVGAGFLPIGLFGTLIWLGALGYLIHLADWIGAAALAASMGIGFVSWSLGFRNARREIIETATGISPFEGMSMGLGYLVQSATLAIAYLSAGIISYCAWGVFGLAILYAAMRYSVRMYPRWARIHYPLMFRWSRFAAQAAIRELEAGQRVDVRPELCDFVDSVVHVGPVEAQGKAQGIVEDADAARTDFVDEELLRELYEERNPSLDRAKLDELMDDVREIVATADDVGLRLRYVIAAFVQNDFGPEERARYLDAVLQGKAT